MNWRITRQINRVGVHLMLIAAAAIILVPVVWTIAAGFRTQISLLMGDVTFTPILSNFHDVLWSKTSDYIQNYGNSIYVGLISTFLCLSIGTLAAWSLSRMKWPGWVVHVFLGWTMLFHMIPPVALAGAWYTMARMTHLDNTYTGLILAHTTLNLPMSIWLMSIFVRDVPKELEEAAIIDGASTPELLRYVVFPPDKTGTRRDRCAVFRVFVERVRRRAEPDPETNRNGARCHREIRPGF